MKNILLIISFFICVSTFADILVVNNTHQDIDVIFRGYNEMPSDTIIEKFGLPMSHINLNPGYPGATYVLKNNMNLNFIANNSIWIPILINYASGRNIGSGVITNQSGNGTGDFTEMEFKEVYGNSDVIVTIVYNSYQANHLVALPIKMCISQHGDMFAYFIITNK